MLLLSLPPLLTARMRGVEVRALWRLYEDTGGANWTNKENWNPANDPCRTFRMKKPFEAGTESPVPMRDEYFEATPWFGVGCHDPCDDYLDGPDCASGRATSLILRENNLHGNLTNWTTVRSLANLTFLDLSFNRVSGALPSELGHINNLEVANFQYSYLSGTVPTELGSFNANGEGPIRELTIGQTELSGVLPSELGELTWMQYFDTTHAHISGFLPSQIARLTQLQALYLMGNAYSGSLPATLGDGMVHMGYVQMHQNRISGQLPATLSNMSKVVNLLLQDNRLQGTLPTQLGGLYEIRQLKLNDNQIGGPVPTQIGRLDGLEELDLYNNSFTGDLPETIANLINLKQLYADNEQLGVLRLHYCRQRMPNVGKYSWHILREEYHRFAQAICEDPYSTVEAFGTLDEIAADI